MMICTPKRSTSKIKHGIIMYTCKCKCNALFYYIHVHTCSYHLIRIQYTVHVCTHNQQCIIFFYACDTVNIHIIHVCILQSLYDSYIYAYICKHACMTQVYVIYYKYICIYIFKYINYGAIEQELRLRKMKKITTSI